MALVSIGSIDDFPEGTPTFAQAEGERLCVVRVGDVVRVICDDCPHAEASLSEGDFIADENAVECPLHGSTFDLVTGEPNEPPAMEAVRVYDVAIVDGDVQVEL
jgi:3-phenylpropionate/trans-cinnamate dioxygenase ferredoxin component